MRFRIIATIAFLVVLGVIVYLCDPSLITSISGGKPSRGSSSISTEF